MSLEEIIVEVQRGRGTHFDPILADVFIRIAEREGACLLVNSAEQVTQRQSSAQYEHAQAGQLLQLRNEHVWLSSAVTEADPIATANAPAEPALV